MRENVVIAALAQKRGRSAPTCCATRGSVPGLNEQVEDALALVHLTSAPMRRSRELAYGEKRRLEIGLALATDPSLCCSTSRSPA